jgi:hypothetical protein
MRQKLSPRDNYRGRTKAGSNTIETLTLVFYTLAWMTDPYTCILHPSLEVEAVHAFGIRPKICN